MNIKKIIIDRKTLITLLTIGFLIRISFSFWLSKFYFGHISYTFGDTFSYAKSFINLLENGTYSFDLKNPDAALYRGPTYPFYWGLHYILFGEDLIYKAVAITQSIIDTWSGFLIYKIIEKLTNSKTISTLGLTAFLFNPIFIVHTPISGTETLATFITILIAYVLIVSEVRNKHLIIGVLCGFALMTRQYLGILLPVSILFAFNRGSHKFTAASNKHIALITMGFCISVTPWFLRNAINHDYPTILMGKTTGYNAYQADYIAFNRLYTLYYVDVTPIVKSIALTGNDGLKQDSKLSEIRDKLDHAARLAYECGPSFASWREQVLRSPQSIEHDCTDKIVKIYTDLREAQIDKHGLSLFAKIPLQNIKKSIFKSELTAETEGWKAIIIQITFQSRTLISILGLSYLLLKPWNKESILLLFPIMLIIYISTVTRQVEMRYLVQSDAITVIFAALSTGLIHDKFKSKMKNIFLNIK